MSVQFFFADSEITLQDRTGLKKFINDLFKQEGKSLRSVTYVFCSDKYLLKINEQFLQHNYYTDIISFDLSDTKKQIEGEIYVSTDRVKDNAQNFDTSIKMELHRVIFHGALHLCGYKDKTSHDLKRMRTAENKYLDLYFNLGECSTGNVLS